MSSGPDFLDIARCVLWGAQLNTASWNWEGASVNEGIDIDPGDNAGTVLAYFRRWVEFL